MVLHSCSRACSSDECLSFVCLYRMHSWTIIVVAWCEPELKQRLSTRAQYCIVLYRPNACVIFKSHVLVANAGSVDSRWQASIGNLGNFVLMAGKIPERGWLLLGSLYYCSLAKQALRLNVSLFYYIKGYSMWMWMTPNRKHLAH
jgi:hypothetical protein